MTFAQVLPDGHIAIPQNVMEQLHLEPGDVLELMVNERGVLVLIQDEKKQHRSESKVTEDKKTAIYQELEQSTPYYPTVQEAMRATRNWEKNWLITDREK